MFDILLHRDPDMGSHTSVVVYLCNGLVWEYKWTHPIHRPRGCVLPINCPDCCVIDSWEEPEVDGSCVKFKCTTQSCTKSLSFDVPKMFPITRVVQKDRAGQWIGYYRTQLDANQSVKWSYEDGVLVGRGTARVK
jgi:hypothetical protein